MLSNKGGDRIILILVESRMELQVVNPTNSTHHCMRELTRLKKAYNNSCNCPSKIKKKILMHL